MNRTELTEILSEKLHIKKSEVTRYMKAWEEEVEKALMKDESVGFMGFGTFSVWKQTARLARNPRENKPWMIASRNSVKFKPSKFLLDRLNGLTDSEADTETTGKPND